MAEPAESPARAGPESPAEPRRPDARPRSRRTARRTGSAAPNPAGPAVADDHQADDQPVRSLRQHVEVLRRRVLVIGVSALAAVLIALVVSLTQPTRYQATTEVLVPPATPSGTDVNQVLLQRTIDPNRAIQDESRIAVAADIVNQVRQRTEGSVSISAKPVKDADVLQITATAATAEGATAAANATAEIYLGKHNAGVAKGTNPGVVLQPATVPTSPSQPTIVRNLVLALIAGLLVGVALAYLIDAFDDE